MNNYLDMTFNDLTSYIVNLQSKITQLELQVAEQSAIIGSYSRDHVINEMRAMVEEAENDLQEMIGLCNELYDGLKMAESQLDKLGVGLRPLARSAVQAFEEMFVEDGD
jgi:hypothetical protein